MRNARSDRWSSVDCEIETRYTNISAPCVRCLTSNITVSRRSSTRGAEMFVSCFNFAIKLQRSLRALRIVQYSTQINKIRQVKLVNLFYYRDVITIAKLKTWTPCAYTNVLFQFCICSFIDYLVGLTYYVRRMNTVRNIKPLTLEESYFLFFCRIKAGSFNLPLKQIISLFLFLLHINNALC